MHASVLNSNKLGSTRTRFEGLWKYQGHGDILDVLCCAVQEAAVAVKFFLKRGEFDREEEVLRHSALSHIVDPTGAVRVLSNFDGSLRAPNGYIYPPCIAMPCGRCLHQWLADPSLPLPDAVSYTHLTLPTICSV